MRICKTVPPQVGLPLLGAMVLAASAFGCSAADPPTAPPHDARAAAAGAHCLPQADGFLRAQLRGALNADLDWRDAQIRCEGGTRPDGAGLRVSIAGPLPDDAGAGSGRTLRFVFGIDTAVGALDGAALATNLTAIIEGSSDADSVLYGTLGDDKCTTDRVRRSATADAAGSAIITTSIDGTRQQEFRVDGRGFCLAPATTLDGSGRLLITTFDFAGRVTLDST